MICNIGRYASYGRWAPVITQALLPSHTILQNVFKVPHHTTATVLSWLLGSFLPLVVLSQFLYQRQLKTWCHIAQSSKVIVGMATFLSPSCSKDILQLKLWWPKSYYSDIKYNLTLNMIFSVAIHTYALFYVPSNNMLDSFWSKAKCLTAHWPYHRFLLLELLVTKIKAINHKGQRWHFWRSYILASSLGTNGRVGAWPWF